MQWNIYAATVYFILYFMRGVNIRPSISKDLINFQGSIP